MNLPPLNDTFVLQRNSLYKVQRVKTSRQMKAKMVRGELNKYFDLKVLSRQQPEIREEGGKTYAKDVKSSNDTFINGERLPPEGVESESLKHKTVSLINVMV